MHMQLEVCVNKWLKLKCFAAERNTNQNLNIYNTSFIAPQIFLVPRFTSTLSQTKLCHHIYWSLNTVILLFVNNLNVTDSPLSKLSKHHLDYLRWRIYDYIPYTLRSIKFFKQPSSVWTFKFGSNSKPDLMKFDFCEILASSTVIHSLSATQSLFMNVLCILQEISYSQEE